tara:strand:- start:533 stop:928 length:396 start_codon:yes stop_codon:yes gene_type:complete
MNLKKLKIFTNKTGSLLPISLKENIPFKSKRVFFIYGKKNFTRGNHAHHRCSQFFIPLHGSMIVHYEFKKKKLKKKLSFNLNNYLLIKPMTWCKIKFTSNNSILVVFCDREYEELDYINNYNEYLNLQKKK